MAVGGSVVRDPGKKRLRWLDEDADRLSVAAAATKAITHPVETSLKAEASTGSRAVHVAARAAALRRVVNDTVVFVEPPLCIFQVDYGRIGPGHVDAPTELVEACRRFAKGRRLLVVALERPAVEDRCVGIEQDGTN